MNVDDLILVSIDDHVVEPPDMFDRHVPAKYRDRVPHVVMGDDGIEKWLFEGQQIGSMGLNAVVELAQGGVGLRPDRLRRDAAGRLRHPRARPRHEPQRHPGVDVLPHLRRVQRRASSRRRRTRTSRSPCVQAYNDWHIDEWCAAYPGRFIPLAIPPIWDPRARGRRGASGRGEGLSRHHHARAAAHPGPARATSTSTTGTRSSAPCRRSRS